MGQAAPMKRILVTGSRTWTNEQMMRNELVRAYRELNGDRGDLRDIVLVHGGAAGADTMAGQIWWSARLPVEVHEAKWKTNGVYFAGAGRARNQKMVDLGADLCLAFIKNNSRGASHCAQAAEDAGIPVRIFRE